MFDCRSCLSTAGYRALAAHLLQSCCLRHNRSPVVGCFGGLRVLSHTHAKMRPGIQVAVLNIQSVRQNHSNARVKQCILIHAAVCRKQDLLRWLKCWRLPAQSCVWRQLPCSCWTGCGECTSWRRLTTSTSESPLLQTLSTVQSMVLPGQLHAHNLMRVSDQRGLLALRLSTSCQHDPCNTRQELSHQSTISGHLVSSGCPPLIAWRPCRFLATDRGAVRYPQFRLWRTQPAFRSRDALLRYETALKHAAALEDALQVRQRCPRCVCHVIWHG